MTVAHNGARARRAASGLIVFAMIALLAATASRAESPALLDYRSESWFLPQTPGVTAGPVGGLFNPGAFALTDRAGALSG